MNAVSLIVLQLKYSTVLTYMFTYLLTTYNVIINRPRAHYIIIASTHAVDSLLVIFGAGNKPEWVTIWVIIKIRIGAQQQAQNYISFAIEN